MSDDIHVHFLFFSGNSVIENTAPFGAHKDGKDQIYSAYSKYNLIIFICSK